VSTPSAGEGRWKRLLKRLNEDYLGLAVIGTLLVTGVAAGISIYNLFDKLREDDAKKHEKLEEEIKSLESRESELRRYLLANQGNALDQFYRFCIETGGRRDFNLKACIYDNLSMFKQFVYFDPGTTDLAPAPKPSKTAGAPKAKHP